MDTTAPLLDQARARAGRLGLGARVLTRTADLEHDLGDLAPPGSVDVAWASMVLHHLEELPRALAGIHRLLRPDGVTRLDAKRSSG